MTDNEYRRSAVDCLCVMLTVPLIIFIATKTKLWVAAIGVMLWVVTPLPIIYISAGNLKHLNGKWRILAVFDICVAVTYILALAGIIWHYGGLKWLM